MYETLWLIVLLTEFGSLLFLAHFEVGQFLSLCSSISVFSLSCVRDSMAHCYLLSLYLTCSLLTLRSASFCLSVLLSLCSVSAVYETLWLIVLLTEFGSNLFLAHFEVGQFLSLCSSISVFSLGCLQDSMAHCYLLSLVLTCSLLTLSSASFYLSVLLSLFSVSVVYESLWLIVTY